MILATTGSNALRHASTGLGVVRYWTYTKYPLGEDWEADFPTTIYLVGCHPPYAVMIWCTASPTEKVLYHSNESCSTTDPGGDYVIAWDRRAYCPWGASEVCPGGGGIEKATLELCLTVTGDDIYFLGRMLELGEGIWFCAVLGCCVECWWKVLGSLGCRQLTSDITVSLPLPEGAMTGNSTVGWTLGPVYISPTGHVTVSGAADYGGSSVSYFGEGDIALDPDYNCPVGSADIDITAVSWSGYDYGGQQSGGVCCPEGTQCYGHEWVCDAGTITITTSIKIGGTC